MVIVSSISSLYNEGCRSLSSESRSSIDDSNIDKGRSKHIELGSTKLFAHNEKTFGQDVNLLQLRVVVHNCFTPLAFNLTGTTKDKYRIRKSRQIDRRTKAGRIRKKATTSKNQLALNMPEKLNNSEFAMLTVLCDSWFISPSFITGLHSNGFEVIRRLSEQGIKYKTMKGTEITIQDVANKIKTAIKQGERFGSIAKSIPSYI